MIQALATWKGRVRVNGVEYDSVADIPTLEEGATLVFLPNTIAPAVEVNTDNPITEVTGTGEHVITVKAYMTKPASPEFDFMARWNNDVPMPLRTMVGTVEKETKGMVYMKLHGQGLPVVHCVRCGRTLTNPVSRHYGLGIECIQKVGIDCGIEDVDKIKEALVNIAWEGWIIKSAITEDISK